jgi:hypothetical protein
VFQRLLIPPLQPIYKKKKLGRPETSPGASTWLVQPIYMVKNVSTETKPRVCTWPVQPVYMIKKVAPETSHTACTWTLQPIYMMKKLVPRLPLKPLHGLYSLYI